MALMKKNSSASSSSAVVSGGGGDKRRQRTLAKQQQISESIAGVSMTIKTVETVRFQRFLPVSEYLFSTCFLEDGCKKGFIAFAISRSSPSTS